MLFLSRENIESNMVSIRGFHTFVPIKSFSLMMFTIDFSRPVSGLNWPEEWLYVRELIEQFASGEDVVLKSSGSTGTPSDHRFSRAQIEASARRTMQALGVDGGEVALVLPVNFTGGRMLLYRAMLYHMTLHLQQPSLSISLTNPVDVISVTPAQWFANKAYLKRCGCVLIGGGDLSGEPSDFPPHVYHSYGMTETLSNVAMRRPSSETHFTALDGVRFSQTQDQALVIHDERLGIAALETNDLVDLIDHKRFIYRGRQDRVVNSGGIKINLDEWMSLWNAHNQFHVQPVGMPDDQLGQKLVLLVSRETAAHIRFNETLNKFPKHWRPKCVYSVETFAHTSSGKPKIFLQPQDVSELAAKIIKP